MTENFFLPTQSSDLAQSKWQCTDKEKMIAMFAFKSKNLSVSKLRQIWPLNCGHGESCNLSHFCFEFHSWNSSPSMHYRCNSGSKSPPFQPKTFLFCQKFSRLLGLSFLPLVLSTFPTERKQTPKVFQPSLLGGFCFMAEGALWSVSGLTPSEFLPCF